MGTNVLKDYIEREEHIQSHGGKGVPFLSGAWERFGVAGGWHTQTGAANPGPVLKSLVQILRDRGIP